MMKESIFEGLPYTKRQYIIMISIGMFLVIAIALLIAISTQFIANTYDLFIAVIFQILFMVLFITLASTGKLNRFLEWTFKKIGITPTKR